MPRTLFTGGYVKIWEYLNQRGVRPSPEPSPVPPRRIGRNTILFRFIDEGFEPNALLAYGEWKRAVGEQGNSWYWRYAADDISVFYTYGMMYGNISLYLDIDGMTVERVSEDTVRIDDTMGLITESNYASLVSYLVSSRVITEGGESSFIYDESTHVGSLSIVLREGYVKMERVDLDNVFFTALPLFEIVDGDADTVSFGNTSVTRVLHLLVRAEDVSEMFQNCGCLASCCIDTPFATNMSRMFYNCYGLMNVDLPHTSSVRTMRYMFFGCSSLVESPIMDTSRVSDMGWMFMYCQSLRIVYAYDTSMVETMDYMFYWCTSLTGLPYMDTPMLRDITQIVNGCTSLVEFPELDTSSVTNMNYAFNGCTSLRKVPRLVVSSLESSISIWNLFNGCVRVESGAYEMYEALSAIGDRFEDTGSVFVDCGSDTESGRADLERIPVSWGGLLE